MEVEELEEFTKDVKRLQKKYRSLPKDLSTLIKVLQTKDGATPPFSFVMCGLKIETGIIKIKKIACRSLKGYGSNSSLKLTYASSKEESRIVLIECYLKHEKANA